MMGVVLFTLIIIRRSAYSSSRLDFQVAEENLLLSMMFMLAVRRTVEELLGDMVVGGQRIGRETQERPWPRVENRAESKI